MPKTEAAYFRNRLCHSVIYMVKISRWVREIKMLKTSKHPLLQQAGNGLLVLLGGFGAVVVIVWAAALCWLTAETLLSAI